MGRKTGFFIEKGMDELKASLVKMPKKYIDVSTIVMFNISVDIMELAKTRIPLESGALRDSGFLLDPSYKGKSKVDLEFGFTGPYAIVQHENLSYNHPGLNSKNKTGGAQGQAKYLETSVNQMEGRLNTEIAAAIKRFTETERMPTLKKTDLKKTKDSA